MREHPATYASPEQFITGTSCLHEIPHCRSTPGCHVMLVPLAVTFSSCIRALVAILYLDKTRMRATEKTAPNQRASTSDSHRCCEPFVSVWSLDCQVQHDHFVPLTFVSSSRSALIAPAEQGTSGKSDACPKEEMCATYAHTEHTQSVQVTRSFFLSYSNVAPVP